MDGSGDIGSAAPDERGPDTDWGELYELRTTTVLSPSMRRRASRRLEPLAGESPDLLEAAACCLRLHESMLLTIAVDGWVWLITLHPQLRLYRASPVDWLRAPPSGLWACWWPASRCPSAPLLAAQRRCTLPPCHYPLAGLIWSLALLGPRNGLRALAEGESASARPAPTIRCCARPARSARHWRAAEMARLPRDHLPLAGWMRCARGCSTACTSEGRLVTEAGPLDRSAEESS